jgi:hypothetical protein
MNNELIHTLTENFDGMISKAKTACELSGHGIADHFADVGKIIQIGKGRKYEIRDTLFNARDFANEIPIHNPSTQSLRSGQQVSQAHVTNDEAGRQALLNRSIRPESLLYAEDVEKDEYLLTSAEKNTLKNPEGLEE